MFFIFSVVIVILVAASVYMSKRRVNLACLGIGVVSCAVARRRVLCAVCLWAPYCTGVDVRIVAAVGCGV
jgi:hypothetical protein